MVELPRAGKWTLRLLAVVYVFFLVGWPLLTLAQRTFADGWSSFSQAGSRTWPAPRSAGASSISGSTR